MIAPLPNRGAVEEDYYDIADLPVDQFRPRDPAIDKAIERLDTFFKDAPQRVFYSTQIETSLERDFFHWIVGKALLELATDIRSREFQFLSKGRQSTSTRTANIGIYVANLMLWLKSCVEYSIRSLRMQLDDTES